MWVLSHFSTEVPFPSRPEPRIVTSLPPSFRSSRACSTCLNPFVLLLLTPLFPAAENGGFMITLSGRLPSPSLGVRMSAMCSAFSLYTSPNLNESRMSALLSVNSLRVSSAPELWAKIARLPVPADGSRTLLPLRILASQFTRYASVGGVLNCWNLILSSVRVVWVGTDWSSLESLRISSITLSVSFAFDGSMPASLIARLIPSSRAS